VFFVTAKEIADNKYDLSLNRYRETVHSSEQFDHPREILARMKSVEMDIIADIEELSEMLQ
jgi:type I restriction enzyme M protein